MVKEELYDRLDNHKSTSVILIEDNNGNTHHIDHISKKGNSLIIHLK